MKIPKTTPLAGLLRFRSNSPGHKPGQLLRASALAACLLVLAISQGLAQTGTGLKADYFPNETLTGNPTLTRTDATIGFDWVNGSPDPSLPADLFSARWSGQIQPQYTETYTFTTTSDDGIRLFVNGKKVIENWGGHAPTDDVGTIALTGGQKYDIRLEFQELWGGAVAKLSWASPSQAKQIVPSNRLYNTNSGSGGVTGSLVVPNSGFETPALGNGNYQAFPAGASWTFNYCGIGANGSGFTSSNGAAPQGTQVAYIQGGGPGFWQPISGFAANASYTITFKAAQRNISQPGQTLDVQVDGVTVKSFTPPQSATTYVNYSAAFTTPGGTSMITFVGTNGTGDNTMLIDDVRIDPTPGTNISVANFGFEAPAVGTGNFQYQPAGGSWNFGSGTGISANGGGFSAANGSAPQGVQVAFIQGGGNISQTFSGFTVGAYYTVAYKAAQRNYSQAGETWSVQLDGSTISSAAPPQSATAYADYTAGFTATAASHSIKFFGTNVNGGDNSVLIDNVRITAGSTPTPDAPTGLSAMANSSSQINLFWAEDSSTQTGFKLERKTGAGGTYAQIATPAASATAYSDTGLAASTLYYYRIRATNAAGDSAYSAEASATTNSSVTAPSAPSSPVASAVSSSQINLTWVDNSNNETGFKLERKTGAGGTYAQIALTGANITSYSDSSLSSATQYYYRVRATNSAGDSSYSVEANATTQAVGTIPDNPWDLTVASVSNATISLTWSDRSNNESGYKLERKLGAGGSYALVATIAAIPGTYVTQGAYTDTGLSASTTYYYRVYAYNGAGNSSYSNEVSGTTAAGASVPAAPSNLAASSVSTSQISIGWTDNASNETGFKIERKTGSGGTYAQIATPGVNATSYLDSGLTNNTQYYYRVSATNAAGNSAYSIEASATTGTSASAFYMVQLQADDGKTGTIAPTFVYVAQPVAGNRAPVISNVSASSTNVAPFASVNLSVNATDADGDPLKYAWIVTAGQLAWSRAATETWVAPSQAGTYKIQVMVGDGKTWSAGYVNVTVNANGTTGVGQHQPSIQSLFPSKVAVLPGETITISATATDIEGDPVGATWEVTGGTVGGSGLSITWTAPASPAATPGRTILPGLSIWDGAPPAGCPFPMSTSILGIGFTSRSSTQDFCDTWMPSWGSDGNLYSSWQDGEIVTAPFVGFTNWESGGLNGNGIARNSWAKLVGNDPQDLMLADVGAISGPLNGWMGRFPGATFMYNNTWYYGSYVADDSDNNGSGTTVSSGNQGVLGGFVGFRSSTDFGHTWNEGPHSPTNRLFAEPSTAFGKVKFGQMYMVDYGQNQNYSPDGKVYFVSNGAVDPDPSPNIPNLGQHIGDQVYLCRVSPTAAALNDSSQYQFFAGNDGSGNPTWTSSLAAAVPIADWNNHFGSTTMVYNPVLNKYLLLSTVAHYSTGSTGPNPEDFDTFVLESSKISGPWKMVSYLKSFGTQAYYPNLPSKFISNVDGRSAWLWFGANYYPFGRKSDPFGAGYHMSQQQIRLLTAQDLQ